MAADVDPRLLEQIDEAGADGQVEALVVLARGAKLASAGADGGLGETVVERVSAEVKEEPTAVRYMPRLGVTYVKGSGRLVRRLLEEDGVIAATANEATVSTD